MFLLRYLMDSMLSCTIISIIVGATKKKIFTIVLFEVMVLCAIVNLLGIALHHILYPFVFTHINLSNDLVYNANDYAVIFMLMQFVGLVVAIPFARKYTKLSPVESRRYID
jgi:ABC-type antimicrobial peptide transport system permease subunit